MKQTLESKVRGVLCFVYGKQRDDMRHTIVDDATAQLMKLIDDEADKFIEFKIKEFKQRLLGVKP